VLLLPRGRTARLTLLIATLLCWACGLLATAAPPADALDATALRATLSREMLRGGFPLAGAYVRDLDTGTALYAHKEDVARPPASIEKLYTTSTALLRFGPATRFHTQVVATGTLDSQGVWRGDLYLRGAGDPTLGQPQIVTLAQTIAAQSGIHRVAGSILGDESVFDSLRGSSRTGYAVDRDIVGVLSGVAVARGFSRDGSPPKEAARRLAKALRAAGVAVDGKSGAGTAPAEAPEVAGIDSPPVGDLIRFTNVPSDNFDAEMLLKRLGASFGGAGTTQAGVGVVRSQLATFGVHPRIVDGSGLSRADRTTPRQVVRLLERMSGTEVATTFQASLPVVGRTGTMRRRMRGTVAQDRCQTKTGTLRAVSALAGYCQTTAGRNVAFAMLMSTPFITRAHRIQDRMTEAIATYGS
jgi:D-alanyl-D-alanine carboxypeptidase/D-alanyl-D-alanine-endopeptidase (penicillin-binding protein 4)